MPQGRFEEILAGCFGVAAAILLIGGWIVVRLLRDRQQFRLMQAALERGMSALPGMTPEWLISLRQGVMALALGIGLIGAGAALHRSAEGIQKPPVEGARGVRNAMTQPGAGAETGMTGRTPPPPPQPPQDRMGQGGGPDWDRPGPPPRRDADGQDGQVPPPRPLPQMEWWHRVESQRLAGTVGTAAGAILVLLGLVRIVFSLLEKKYATELAAPGNAKS